MSRYSGGMQFAAARAARDLFRLACSTSFELQVQRELHHRLRDQVDYHVETVHVERILFTNGCPSNAETSLVRQISELITFPAGLCVGQQVEHRIGSNEKSAPARGWSRLDFPLDLISCDLFK